MSMLLDIWSYLLLKLHYTVICITQQNPPFITYVYFFFHVSCYLQSNVNLMPMFLFFSLSMNWQCEKKWNYIPDTYRFSYISQWYFWKVSALYIAFKLHDSLEISFLFQLGYLGILYDGAMELYLLYIVYVYWSVSKL